MKKIPIKVLIIITTITALFSFGIWLLWSFSAFSYKEADNINGFEIYEGVWDCFVGAYTPNNESKTIIIPDSYKNKPIKSLGGYYGRGVPVLFCINSSYEQDCWTLVIGKNIKQLNKYDFSGISEIICNENNKTFYSQDGELFYRKNNEKIKKNLYGF